MGQLSAGGKPPCIVTAIVQNFPEGDRINASGEADCANTTADELGERRDVGSNAQSNLQTLGRSASAIFRKSIPVAKLGLRYAARHLDIEEVA